MTIWWLPLLILIAACAVLGWAGVGAATWWLRRRQILDRPNHRSSHTVPTPRGGGLGLLPSLALLMLALPLIAPSTPAEVPWVLGGTLALALLSFIDDLTPLPAGLRFGVHGAAVATVLILLPADATLFHPVLPLWLERILIGLGWVWFVNLYNFMDGIDGITGTETASLGLGVALIALATQDLWFVGFGGGVAALALAFLVWNWHPARVFMGDVGSIPLGFCLGWLLLKLALTGLFAAALILPLYYAADATLTLLRRAARGEKLWQAHRQHFYQQAVQAGLSHSRVAAFIGRTNLGLIALAFAAAQPGWGGGWLLAPAGALVGLALWQLQRGRLWW